MIDRELNALQRVYLANRGVWEAITSAGSGISVAHTGAGVAAYLAAFTAFAEELTA